MNELLPCPFCGGEASLEYDSHWNKWCGQCEDCGCEGESAYTRDNKDPQAIASKDWNQRYSLNKNEHYDRGFNDAKQKMIDLVDKLNGRKK